MIDYKGWSFPDIDTHFQSSVDEFPITTYQQATIDKAYNYINNFNCAVDIGANIGLHSVRFASKFNTVFSFEPVTTNFECLIKNTSTFNNVTCFKNGVGNTSNILNIKIPANSVNCGAYSFVDFEDFDDIIKEKIQIVRLDDFDLIPNLIKIDTQGFEEEVLLGAVKTLKLYSPVIIIEIENKKQKNILEKILDNLSYRFIENHRRDYIWMKK